MCILKLPHSSFLPILLSTLCIYAGASDSNIDDVESLRSLLFAPNSGEVIAAFESFQSSVCSPADERFQRQCFSELPADRYEVLEGSPVRMRCRVSWQSGKAQWRAHNTLLGTCHIRLLYQTRSGSVGSCDPHRSAFKIRFNF
ncbi:unnamed protein product [Hydatigera taeniaeformis]|uniref:Ig-like domain-containing protein n=1 Tax=Hydatigena taeniaeformis TaxID=6205 RepID=A0A0R3WI55_HYDTA|nr:unnamed protein product [Hydatigera taeniaeformis]